MTEATSPWADMINQTTDRVPLPPRFGGAADEETFPTVEFLRSLEPNPNGEPITWIDGVRVSPEEADRIIAELEEGERELERLEADPDGYGETFLKNLYARKGYTPGKSCS